MYPTHEFLIWSKTCNTHSLHFSRSKFRDHILRSDSFVNKFTVRGATVPTKKYTIFAPINSAYANIERAGNIDMSQDPELNERVSSGFFFQFSTFHPVYIYFFSCYLTIIILSISMFKLNRCYHLFLSVYKWCQA